MKDLIEGYNCDLIYRYPGKDIDKIADVESFLEDDPIFHSNEKYFELFETFKELDKYFEYLYKQSQYPTKGEIENRHKVFLEIKRSFYENEI